MHRVCRQPPGRAEADRAGRHDRPHRRHRAGTRTAGPRERAPWDDPSGDRLRQWLGLIRDESYDPETVGPAPMGLCPPGSGPSGDEPPRPECATLWHQQLLAHLPVDRLEIVIGAHARAHDIARRGDILTETVASRRASLPRRVVLPHPSPRDNRWRRRNPWFSSETLPSDRARVQQVLAD